MIPVDFHFIEPRWFLALIPLLLILYVSFRHSSSTSSWEKVIDAKLLPLLLQGKDKSTGRFAQYFLAFAWLLSVLALADPVWEKVPKPIFQTSAARVLVLDLSNSMLIDDLKPNRLARARFKIEDILSRKEEGQTGLVLFAGGAFTASPLTRDNDTIRSILKVLTPQIMPAQGSRVDLGLDKAHELLTQAGIHKGQVLLIADGVSQQQEALKSALKLQESGHRVSVLAVGTEEGGDLRFSNNKTVNVKLEDAVLRQIAEVGHGNFRLISNTSSDLKGLLLPINANGTEQNSTSTDDDLQNSDWKSTGPLIALLLLPFGALAFRRGWLLTVLLSFSVLAVGIYPRELVAEENKWWGVLTKNKKQRANQALRNGKYEQVTKLTNDLSHRASVDYKLGEYESALDKFKKLEGAEARYNEGNTLAQQKKYKEAIAAYDQALKSDPNLEDASANKKLLEELLEQQSQSEQNQQSSEDGEQGDSENESKQQNKQDQEGSQSADSKSKSDQQQQNEQDKKNQFDEANKSLANKKENEGDNQDQQEQSTSEENTASDEKTTEDMPQQETKFTEEDKGDEQQKKGVKQLADELSKEEKMAAEQWLRRIPDDPGGLLKRKFSRQYNRTHRGTDSNENPW